MPFQEPSNFQTESLVECTSIVKKLTTVKISWQILTREQCHLSLTRLLRTNEGALLPLALLVLIDLTSENTFRRAFEHLRIMDALLHILEVQFLFLSFLTLSSNPNPPALPALHSNMSPRSRGLERNFCAT